MSETMTITAAGTGAGRVHIAPSKGVRQRAPGVKLPVKIARQLEDRILSEGWPIGHQIGHEASLAVDMGVCRHTLREAVRILEVSGFVESRKGKKGGLFVAANAYDFACKTFSNYLEFVQIDPNELTDLHRILTRFTIDRAIDDLSKSQSLKLLGQIDSFAELASRQRAPGAEDLHHALLDEIGNPALKLFLGVLNRLILDASILSTLGDEQWGEMRETLINLFVEMVTATLAGRRDAAFSLCEQFVHASTSAFKASSLIGWQPVADRAAQRAYDFLPRAKPVKKAERVEREIRDMVIAQGWPVGHSLGSEAELAARFDVGRSVLREALRSLEQLGVVEMGRGGRSGLRVISPDPATVTQTCRRYLRRERLTADQANSLRSAIEERPSKETGDMKQLFLSILA